MIEPLVTVVTPSLNQGSFIRSTIESVLSQDYPNLEYIIMDGGSTDETASVVKDYASRLTWISEPDRGQSHAINKGFRLARGSVVSWLNSDDIILPGAIRKAVSAFAENPDAGAVYGEGYLIDRPGNITGRFPHTEPLNLWKLVYLSNYILQQSSYFRNDVIRDVGYLREDLHYAMDWDLFIRIAKRYPLQHIPEYMGCLREYSEAKSFTGGGKRIKEIAGVLREHTGLRYPPGYVVYGLDTYRKIWAEYVHSRISQPSSRVSQLLQRVIDVACLHCIGWSIHRSQGWYSDLWAGPKVKYMLPRGSGGVLVLSGSVPCFRWGRQKLTIANQGVRIAQRTFHPGDFEWRVPLPTGSGDETVNLVFKASRSFVPRLKGPSTDARRLAYILRSVRIERRGQDETNEPDPEFARVANGTI